MRRLLVKMKANPSQDRERRMEKISMPKTKKRSYLLQECLWKPQRER
jgi:hypothetical protein